MDHLKKKDFDQQGNASRDWKKRRVFFVICDVLMNDKGVYSVRGILNATRALVCPDSYRKRKHLRRVGSMSVVCIE